MGDDHMSESSTTAHQSEFAFVDVMMPILNPAGIQEIVDYGLYGWALSRFSGAWAGSVAGAINQASRAKPIGAMRVFMMRYLLEKMGLPSHVRDG